MPVKMIVSKMMGIEKVMVSEIMGIGKVMDGVECELKLKPGRLGIRGGLASSSKLVHLASPPLLVALSSICKL